MEGSFPRCAELVALLGQLLADALSRGFIHRHHDVVGVEVLGHEGEGRAAQVLQVPLAL